VFSGNTCYRPVKFTCDAAGNPVGMCKLAGDWDLLTEKPNNDPRAYGNERHLIGLSYTYGGGHYGRWKTLARRLDKPQARGSRLYGHAT